MANILIDTNIVLDLLSFSRPAHHDAQRFLEESLDTGHGIFLSASSLKDVYYILNKMYNDELWARDDVNAVKNLFSVVELTVDIIDTALASDEPDFEDGIIRVTAEKIGAAAIVSRDEEAFKNGYIPCLTPQVAAQRFASKAASKA